MSVSKNPEKWWGFAGDGSPICGAMATFAQISGITAIRKGRQLVVLVVQRAKLTVETTVEVAADRLLGF